MDFPKPLSIAEDPILTFGILLLMMIIIPLLFRQIKLTGVVGLILFGSVIGPNTLGWIEARGVIDVLGIIGLLYLMFMAGLEMNLDRFNKEKNNAVIFGLLTFSIPMIMGTVIFLWIGFTLSASLLIASMFASHTLVTYPIVMRLNLTKEKSVSSTIGATVITDTSALLVLAIVARSVDDELGFIFWGTLILSFAGYLIFMFYLLPKISYHFFRFINYSGRYTFSYVIGMMLICSWLAHIIGIEAILGAFLAGLAFNRLLTNRGALKNRIDFFGDTFFIPIFLVFVGMQVDFRVIFSEAQAWVIMSAMLLTGILTKAFAAYLSGKILKFNSNQIWVMFGMSVTEGAATLAAVFVGFDLGIFGEEVFNGAVLLILVTCLIGPLIVEKFGFKLTDETTYELEKGEKKGQRILVPLSNPQTSSKLIEISSNISTNDDGIIYPLTVLNKVKDHIAQRERSDKILELASGQIHAIDHEAHPVFKTNLNVAEGIIEAAEQHSITDIVIGWNGEISTKVRVFGGIVDQVLSSSTQQIFICKMEQPVSSFQKIKIVMSPKMSNDKKFIYLLNTLLNLAENINAKVEIFYVISEKMQIKRHLNLLKKIKEWEPKKFTSFDLLMDKLFADLNLTDLLVVTNKHADNYGWAHGTNIIPRRLTQTKANNSFIIAYPARDFEEPFSHDSLIYTN